MKSISLSVVIPTFRRGRSLLAALESLQGQALLPTEIIVADNAADPDVRRLVEEFGATARAPVQAARNYPGLATIRTAYTSPLVIGTQAEEVCARD